MSYEEVSRTAATIVWETGPEYVEPNGATAHLFWGTQQVDGSGVGPTPDHGSPIGGPTQFGPGRGLVYQDATGFGGVAYQGKGKGSVSVFVLKPQGCGGSPVDGAGYGPEEATIPWGYAQNLFEGWGLGTQELMGQGTGTSPGGGFATGPGDALGDGLGFCPPGGVVLGGWLEHGKPRGIFGQAGLGTGLNVLDFGEGVGGIGPYRGVLLGSYPIKPEGYGGCAPNVAAGLGKSFYVGAGVGHLFKELTYPYFLFPGYSSDEDSIVIPIADLPGMTAEKADAVDGDWRELAQSVLLCVSSYLNLRDRKTSLATVSVTCNNTILDDTVFGKVVKRNFAYKTMIDLPVSNVADEPE